MVLGREEGLLGMRGRMSRLEQVFPERLVALAHASGKPFARAFMIARRYSRPGAKMCGRWETVHVGADLADNGLSGRPCYTRDRVQAHHSFQKRGMRLAYLLDGLVEAGDAGVQVIDLGKQLLKDHPMMRPDPAEQGLFQHVLLLAHTSSP